MHQVYPFPDFHAKICKRGSTPASAATGILAAFTTAASVLAVPTYTAPERLVVGYPQPQIVSPPAKDDERYSSSKFCRSREDFDADDQIL